MAALVTRRRSRPGCEVCHERRRQEAQSRADWERIRVETPPAPREINFGPLLGPWMILVGLLVFVWLEVRALPARLEEDDEEQPEGVELGED